MLNEETVSQILDGLRILPYYPLEEAAHAALVRMVCNMVATEDHIHWLVARMTGGLYAMWPGPSEVRAMYCMKHRPKDGVNAYSSVYPDGIPSEKKKPLLGAGAGGMRLLEDAKRGQPVTDDAKLNGAVSKAAMRMPRPVSRERTAFAKLLEELGTPPELREPLPPSAPQVITQEDIDRAVAKLHEEKAERAASGPKTDK